MTPRPIHNGSCPSTSHAGVHREHDTFSKGPLPFADFLYDLNRKHALERLAKSERPTEPTLAPTSELSPAGSDACAAPGLLSSPEIPPDGEPISPKRDDQTTARVLHLSRPVGRFIDLYV